MVGKDKQVVVTLQQGSSCLGMDWQSLCKASPKVLKAIFTAVVEQLEVATVALDNDNTAALTFLYLYQDQATKHTYELMTSFWSYRGVLCGVAGGLHSFRVVGRQCELPTSHSLGTRIARSSWHCVLRGMCHSCAANLVPRIAGLSTKLDLSWSKFGYAEL